MSRCSTIFGALADLAISSMDGAIGKVLATINTMDATHVNREAVAEEWKEKLGKYKTGVMNNF
jgi:hypothetical protein